ncbi:hypothetical protein HK096_003820 [Nowakowskiella sp. JEL0078]|nr:hypothetical protein HK096_003820 [Nowakowskiella sp. JEL0078]
MFKINELLYRSRRRSIDENIHSIKLLTTMNSTKQKKNSKKLLPTLTNHQKFIKKKKNEKINAIQIKKNYYKQGLNPGNSQVKANSNSEDEAFDNSQKVKDPLFAARFDPFEDLKNTKEDLQEYESFSERKPGLKKPRKRNFENMSNSDETNSDSEAVPNHSMLSRDKITKNSTILDDKKKNAKIQMELSNDSRNLKKEIKNVKEHKPNPFQKQMDEIERKHKEKEEEIARKDKERKDKEERQKTRKLQSSRLLKRTRRGQPVIKNMMDHLLEKIKKG